MRPSHSAVPHTAHAFGKEPSRDQPIFQAPTVVIAPFDEDLSERRGSLPGVMLSAQVARTEPMRPGATLLRRLAMDVLVGGARNHPSKLDEDVL